jgi:hypothetical protein
MIRVETVTAPAVWASYLINGDASGITDQDREACDAWHAAQAPFYVVSCTDDDPRFTWSYRLHGGNAGGGDVLDYILHSTEEA